MEAMNFEVFFIFLIALGFASSLLHYRAYAKIKAHETVKKDLFSNR